MSSAKRKARELEAATAAQSVKINARATRGKREKDLEGEDAEADQEFWEQEAWKDGADSEYSTEKEEQDVFDSDFNESEDQGDEDEEERAEKSIRREEWREKRKAAESAGTYKEPKKAIRAPNRVKVKEQTEIIEIGTSGPARNMRESTISKSLTSTKEREAIAVRGKNDSDIVHWSQQKQPVFSQRDMLLEAAMKTEHENTNWVAHQRRLAEEAQTLEAQPRKQVPFVSRFISQRGYPNIVIFPQVDMVPKILRLEANTKSTVAKAAVCKITGRPAKYRDPLTGHFFSDSEAFKKIRSKLKSKIQKKTEIAMEREGTLSPVTGSIEGEVLQDGPIERGHSSGRSTMQLRGSIKGVGTFTRRASN